METQNTDTDLALRALTVTDGDRRTARRTFSRIALSLVAYNAVTYVVIVLIRIFLALVGGADALTENILFSWLLSAAPMYCCGLPILWLILRGMPKYPLRDDPPAPKDLLILFLVSRAALLLGSGVSQVLISALERLLGYEIADTTTALVEKTPVWILVLFVVLLAPLVEELIFRKLFIDRLACYGDGCAILFTSVLFGIAHGNFYQFFYTFLLGLLLGYLYTRTGKLRYPFLLHAVTNFLGSVAVLPVLDASQRLEDLLSEEVPQTLEMLRLTGTVLSYSAVLYGCAVAGAVFFFLHRRRIRLKEGELLLPRATVLKSAVVNLGVLLFFLLSVGEFILSVLPTA